MSFLRERQGFGEGDAVVFVLHGQLDGFIGDSDGRYMGIAGEELVRVIICTGGGGGGVPLAVALVVESEFVDGSTAAVLKVFGYVLSVGADEELCALARFQRAGTAAVFFLMAEDIHIVCRGFRELRKGRGEGRTAQEQGQEKAVRLHGGMMPLRGCRIKQTDGRCGRKW